MEVFVIYLLISIILLLSGLLVLFYFRFKKIKADFIDENKKLLEIKNKLEDLTIENEKLLLKINQKQTVHSEDKNKFLENSVNQKLLEAENKAKEIIKKANAEYVKKQKQLLELEKTILERQKVLEEKDIYINQKEKKLEEEYKQIQAQKDYIKEYENKIQGKLAEVANLSMEEAKRKLFEIIRKNMTNDIANEIRLFKEKLEKEKDRIAKEIIVDAMTASATDFVSEFTTSIIKIENPEFKGKIIGKEGRNIKTFQRITGVDLIIDEEDEYITISCFDPLRREIAKIALSKLLKDGRINPARIEEVVDKSRIEINKQIIKDGEEIAMRAGFSNLSLEKLKYLGRMKYRFSYGQCLATHVLEVVNFVEKAASELGLNVELAKECALWHDIGKVETHEKDGNHIEIGEQIGIKLGLREEVINAMYAHHLVRDPICMESALVYIADANSAARPGARSGTEEDYVKRIRSLEEIAKKHEGVKEAYAIEAGREIRIFVDPVILDDSAIIVMSNEIANEIKNKLSYPGIVKVTVIREVRAESIAN